MINQITSNKVERLLFKFFIFLLPTQLTKHFWLTPSYVFGIRVDFLAPAIYLTDLILITFIGVWFYRLRSSDFNYLIKKYLFNWWILMAGLLIMLNVYFSSYFQISIFRWIKVIEVYLLFIFIKENKQLKLVNDLIYPLVLSAIIFSLLGIVQFYYQHTLGGIFRFLGERSFTSETTGIAKVSLFGRETLRAYSTFSHPNSMAGYLAAVLLFVRATLKQNKNDERLLMVFYITLFVGLVLTFSKGVLMALLIIVAMMVLTRYKETVFRLVTRYFVLLVLLTTFLILLIPVQISETSVMQRLFLNRAALEVLMTNPLTGVGLGAFIINLPGLSNMLNIRWILQPVHNIYLLILAETGLIGLILFTAGATTVFNKANKSIIFVLMFILITGLLDHYWLTLQQNLMFIGIILAVSERPFEQNIVVFKDNG